MFSTYSKYRNASKKGRKKESIRPLISLTCSDLLAQLVLPRLYLSLWFYSEFCVVCLVVSQMSKESNNMLHVKLNDKNCVLVQFCNERKKPVQVGFQAWLLDKENDVNECIDKEVLIKWPLNIDIACAKSMERKFKNHKAHEWKNLVVKVIAVGEWIEMCKQAKNYERFGYANPTKEQRHILCSKKGTSDDESTSSSSYDIDISKMKHKQQYALSCKESAAKNKKLDGTKKNNSNKQTYNTSRGTVGVNINRKIVDEVFNMQEYSPSGYAFSDDGQSLSENENISHAYKTQVVQEKHKLEMDSANLRTLTRCVSNDLHAIKGVSAAILIDVQKIQQEINMLKKSKCEHAKEERASTNSTFINVASKDCTAQQETSSLTLISARTNINDVPSTSRNTLHATTQKQIHSTNLYPVIPKANTPTSMTANECTSISLKYEEDSDNTVNNTSVQSATINFGGKHIDVERIRRIDKSKGISAFSSALMNMVFTSEEMATSTMTGIVSNFQKNNMDGENKKQELNPLKRDAIIDFIMKEFEIFDRRSAEYKKLKNTMKVKLNNEAAYMKRKRIT